MDKQKDLKSLNDLMEELGFQKSAKQSTKAAFLKNLFKQAYGVEVTPPSIYTEPEQLTFFEKEKNEETA